MTPEERFGKIENVLSTIAEIQARQTENLDRHDAELAEQKAIAEKHNTAIRDLIVVSRTILQSTQQLDEAHKRLSADIDRLREAQRTTDEKLHILIETVDRIIRNQGK